MYEVLFGIESEMPHINWAVQIQCDEELLWTQYSTLAWEEYNGIIEWASVGCAKPSSIRRSSGMRDHCGLS